MPAGNVIQIIKKKKMMCQQYLLKTLMIVRKTAFMPAMQRYFIVKA